MKVYLDDVRQPPEGYVLVKTPKEAIKLLKTEKVDMISLDHDLGDDEKIGTGYDVLLYIEVAIMTNNMKEMIPHGMPIIKVHSANPVAVEKMRPLANKLMIMALKD